MNILEEIAEKTRERIEELKKQKPLDEVKKQALAIEVILASRVGHNAGGDVNAAARIVRDNNGNVLLGEVSRHRASREAEHEGQRHDDGQDLFHLGVLL